MIARSLRSDAGFTYIGAIVMVVIFGIMASQAAQLWTMRMQREREAELIFHGTQVRDALRRRYGLTLNPYGAYVPPGSPPVNPAPVTKIPPNAPKLNELKDLVQASDSAGKKRFMRLSDLKVNDPVTGKLIDWELFKDPATQRIIGVYIKSEALPVKQANFPPDLQPADFEGKKKYSDWVFICDRYPTPGAPGGVTGLQTSPTQGGNPGSSPAGTMGNNPGTMGNNPGVPGAR